MIPLQHKDSRQGRQGNLFTPVFICESKQGSWLSAVKTCQDTSRGTARCANTLNLTHSNGGSPRKWSPLLGWEMLFLHSAYPVYEALFSFLFAKKQEAKCAMLCRKWMKTRALRERSVLIYALRESLNQVHPISVIFYSTLSPSLH